MSSPPLELLVEVELVVPVVLAAAALGLAGFKSPMPAAGVTVFNIVGSA